eukprot:COSAG06_NODE_18475_length_885_cov_7.842239_2_plen_128_part_00
MEDCDAKEVCVCACLGALATTRCCYRCGAPVGDTIGGEKKPPAAQICLRSMYYVSYIASESLDRLGDDRRNAAAFWSSAHLCTLQPSKMAEAEAQVMEQIDIGHVLPTPLDTRRKFFVSEVHAAPRA